MKAIHKLFTITLVASLSFGLMACSNSTETEPTPTEVVKVELSESVKSNVAQLLEGYFAIKDAMVTSDPAIVKAASDSLLAQITVFDTNGLDETIAARLTSEIDAIRYGAQNISEAEGIDAQREYLPALTENMITLVSGYAITDVPVYKQYCPMAFGNKGASWLSDSDSVINPYFGDVMLRCGEVTETL